MDNLHTLLKEANITLIISESFADNPANQVQNIKVCLTSFCFYYYTTLSYNYLYSLLLIKGARHKQETQRV